MKKTATGMPATLVGYWIGRLLCAVGIHKRIYVRGFIERRISDFTGIAGWAELATCVRDCQWSRERWEALR